MHDYFIYLPKPTSVASWGCAATGAGHTKILPHQPYPRNQHPLDHHFDWQRGRVLPDYQFILISSGTGVFECGAMPGVHAVTPGTLLLLFPGVWHRYRPAADTGWEEHWLECSGPALDEAVKKGVLQPTQSLLPANHTADLQEVFERCHHLAHLDALGNQDLLSTLGLQLITLASRLRPGENAQNKVIDDAVRRAHTLIALRCHLPLDLEGLAKELGVGYSHLRHSFQARTGISLRDHYLNVRLQKSKDLLISSGKSVKEIADLLGFESASHFSKQFKDHLGDAPQHWREKQIKDTGVV